jgi:hypothetical protein
VKLGNSVLAEYMQNPDTTKRKESIITDRVVHQSIKMNKRGKEQCSKQLEENQQNNKNKSLPITSHLECKQYAAYKKLTLPVMTHTEQK